MSLPVIAELFHGLASTFRATDIELAHWSHLVGDAFLADCPGVTVEAARRAGFMFGITNDGRVAGWRNQGRSAGQTIDGEPLFSGPSLFFGPTYDGLIPMREGNWTVTAGSWERPC